MYRLTSDGVCCTKTFENKDTYIDLSKIFINDRFCAKNGSLSDSISTSSPRTLYIELLNDLKLQLLTKELPEVLVILADDKFEMFFVIFL